MSYEVAATIFGPKIFFSIPLFFIRFGWNFVWGLIMEQKAERAERPFFEKPAQPTKVDKYWKFLSFVFFVWFGWNPVWQLRMELRQYSLEYLQYDHFSTYRNDQPKPTNAESFKHMFLDRLGMSLKWLHQFFNASTDTPNILLKNFDFYRYSRKHDRQINPLTDWQTNKHDGQTDRSIHWKTDRPINQLIKMQGGI